MQSINSACGRYMSSASFQNQSVLDFDIFQNLSTDLSISNHMKSSVNANLQNEIFCMTVNKC